MRFGWRADEWVQQNSENQVPEEIDGVGGNEQKKVRQYVVSRVGPREG
jgi:26S proteasome non-ATPase regulatory subunit 10